MQVLRVGLKIDIVAARCRDHPSQLAPAWASDFTNGTLNVCPPDPPLPTPEPKNFFLCHLYKAEILLSNSRKLKKKLKQEKDHL